MQRFLIRSSITPLTRSLNPTTFLSFNRFKTTPNNPNPANFQNRPRDKLSQIGRKGGKKGGKARGVGGFKSMESGKQHAISSKGGHASKRGEGRDRNSFPMNLGHPSSTAPGFDESLTA